MVNYDRLPNDSRYFSGTLYDTMRDDLQLDGKAKRTVHGYLRAVRQLADYCQRTPDQISEQQLRQDFLYLKNEKRFAYGSMRVALSGIKFFYTRTCPRGWKTLATIKLQQAKIMPDVLTIEQVHAIINACRVQRIAVYFWTTHRHPSLLFPAEGRNHWNSTTAKTPIQTSTVQKAMSKIAQQLNFAKRVTIHTISVTVVGETIGSDAVAEIATAPTVATKRRRSGSRNSEPGCCRCITFW